MNRILVKLLSVIKKNKKKKNKQSYTAKLFKSGISGCKKKFIEEVNELIISLKYSKDGVIHEAADVFFHYLVLLERKGVDFRQVVKELQKRSKMSGISEKLNRLKNVR